MALTIRLSRRGAKSSPHFLVVAVDETKKRDGAYLERLGVYRPKAKTAAEKLQINQDAFKGWIARGAKCSETVGQLVKSLAK